MLENLVNLVKEFAGEAVVNNPDVPNEHNNDVVAEATSTVASGLQNVMAGGGLQNILGLFGGGGQKQGLMGNPIVNMMVGHFANKLMSKFGIGGGKAGSIAQSLIPSVLSNLIGRTNDPNNSSFNLESIIGSLAGGGQQQAGGGGGIMDMIKGLTGGGQQGGGGGLMDLIGKFTGGGQQQQQEQSSGGGGLMDLISKVTQGAQQTQQQQAGGGGILDMIKGFIK